MGDRFTVGGDIPVELPITRQVAETIRGARSARGLAEVVAANGRVLDALFNAVGKLEAELVAVKSAGTDLE